MCDRVARMLLTEERWQPYATLCIGLHSLENFKWGSWVAQLYLFTKFMPTVDFRQFQSELFNFPEKSGFVHI